MLADDVKLDSSPSCASKERARSGNTTLPMQLPNSGLRRRALSMAGPRCSCTIARFHSGRLPILPWISMAIAWSRSTTSYMPVMRWTVSTCPHSIPKRYHKLAGLVKQLQHIARIVTRSPRLSTLSTLEAEFRQHCCHQGQSVSNLLDSTKCCNLGPSQYPANTPPKTAVSRRLDAVYR